MTVQTSATDRARRNRRWLVWGLTASLALNGLLIGSILAGLFAGPTERRGMFWRETRVLSKNLPQAQVDSLRGSLRDMIPELRGDWRRLRELRREINRMAAEPQPDRAAIDARLAEIRQITSRMQADVQGRLFDELLALPPQMRARLAEED